MNLLVQVFLIIYARFELSIFLRSYQELVNLWLSALFEITHDFDFSFHNLLHIHLLGLPIKC